MSLMRVSLLVTALALLSRLLGLGRDLAITWAFGATAETDAFYIASSLSNAAYVVIAASLTSATIPFLASHSDPETGRVEPRALANLLNTVALALILLAVAGAVFAHAIAGFLVAGGSETLVDRTAHFMVILMPTIVMLGVAGVLAGLLNHNHVFLPVAAAPAALNLAVILAVVLLSGSQGIQAAVLGTFAGAAVFFLMQLPRLHRIDYRHLWRLAPADPSIRQFAASALPVLAVALLTYAYTFVDIAIGTSAGEGTVTAINVATKLIQLPQGVIAMGLTTASFPLLSRLVTGGQIAEASRLAMRLTVVIALISVPATALMMVEADLIVRIVFGRGTFSQAAVAETTGILAIMVLSLPAFSMNILLLRVCYALKMWRAPVLAFLLAFVVKLALAFALADRLGALAVSWSTVIAVTLNCAVLLITLNRPLLAPFGAAFAGSLMRILAVGLATGGGLMLLRRGWTVADLPAGGWAEFLLLSLAGVALSLGLARLLAAGELGYLGGLRSERHR